MATDALLARTPGVAVVSATMAFVVASRVHVAVHTAAAPSNREWRAYLDHIEAHLDGVDAIFSLTVGGGPDSSQRGYAVEFWRRQPKQPRIAVVTPSMLVVRMAGALRWFMPSQIKSFLPRDAAAAHEYLGLTPAQRAAVPKAIEALKRELGIALEPAAPAP
jgi:hypothetical protein